ncbi:unnamed protein product [Bursaphelenchus xylophilus]|uniref:(pine wood nematode) hypothetical protein n=1 Tax=Bursaphelenchus xylophilus TaxID=6326 RepID=A0A1I7S3G6_BURXY|nr:unnamed protein product [Bursaphelenchus xylophilus]CAG9116296.1 unnamed protein product [Bursaphelenchus xylophilus]
MSLEGRVENFLRGLVGRSSTKQPPAIPKPRSRSAHTRSSGVVTYPELPLARSPSTRRSFKKENTAGDTDLPLQTDPNQPLSEEDTMHWMKRFRKSFRGRSARKTIKPTDTVTTKEEKTDKNTEPSKKEKKKEPLIRKDTIVVDPKKKLIVQRTRSITHKQIVDKESRDPPQPLVTHFPVDNPDLVMTSVEYDQYGGMSPQALWGKKPENYQKPNQESGYNSPLEVQVSPTNVTSGPTSKSNPRSPSLPPSRFSSPGSPVHHSHPLDRQRFLAKSESNLRRLLSSDNSEQMVAFLRKQVQETKYVTAVFESAKGGIAPILGDIVKEMSHWLGTYSRLLAVACEVHWSVPEKIRSRVVEIRMKEELHRVLRQNNSRVLRLYDENGGVIPLNLIDSKTEENCARDAGLDAFQGIYRRYYPALLNLQDYTTMDTHKSYWTLENLGNYRTPLQPAPTKFMYRPSRDILAKKSIVALNMAVLRMHGDDWDYENEARKP